MRVFFFMVFTLVCLQSVALLTSATIERNADRLIESGGTVAHMLEQLAFASRIDPFNIHLLEVLAQQESDPEVHRELVQSMVEREPARVEGWLQLYQYKLMRAEYDDELVHTMSQLDTLAPYEPHVHETVIREGLDHWFQMGPKARRLVVDTAVRTMSSHAHHRQTQRHRLVTNGGLMPMVCALSPDIDQCQ